MKTILFTLALMLVIYQNECWSQNESKTPETCIYIPNNPSVRCDDYNKDLPWMFPLLPPALLIKWKYLRGGEPPFSPPTLLLGPWYGGRESAGVYTVILTYSSGQNPATEDNTLENLQQQVNLIK